MSQSFTIEQLNSLTKEQLKAYGIVLQTRKEKTPEQIEKTRQFNAYKDGMNTYNAQMENGTWICMDDDHIRKDGKRVSTYNLSKGYQHIIKHNCKAVRLCSVELYNKHGNDMFTRKHITLAMANKELPSTIQFETKRKEEKLLKELAKLQG
jgi:hypothetical protein